VTIGLHPYEGASKPGSVGGIQIGFAVDNIKESVRNIKEMSVECTSEIIDDG
jgi:hypothetical protein